MTVPLSAVAAALPSAQRQGDDVEVRDASHDSRQIDHDWLFCAITGQHHDGHDHAGDAQAAGASALLVERWLPLEIAQLKVPSVRHAVGLAASVIHGRPSEELAVVGLTGTNGKTTIAYLLEAAAAADGYGTGVIGTIEARIHGERLPGVRTTPEGTDLQRLLRHMSDRGVELVAMEVSSHGLDLHRVDGTRFRVGVFTNLSQDHLDWHGTMDAYFAAKARLFSLAEQAVVVIDDSWGRRVAEGATIPVTTLGRASDAEVRIIEQELTVEGGRARVRFGGTIARDLLGEPVEVEVSTHLPGDFNLLNAVTAVVTAVRAGVDLDAALAGVAACEGAPGRLERVPAPDGMRVFVDYAHTPEAVSAVLRTLRQTMPTDARLIVVLGAGGERDQGKRPGMGAAATLADVAVLTSDNPRSEDPQRILEAIVGGARDALASRPGSGCELVVELDRRRAIERAIERAAPSDVIVIAGKGHETTQQIGERTISFDDRRVAAEILAGGHA